MVRIPSILLLLAERWRRTRVGARSYLRAARLPLGRSWRRARAGARSPLLVATLLLLAGCATATLPDAFRTGRDPRFPAERYLVGVGEGASIEIARRRAVASIAAQIHASVRATELVAAVASTAAGESEVLQQDIEVVSRFDRPAWIQLADAVEIDGRVHALCVLDRSRARALLAAERATMRGALAAALDRAEREENLAARTAAIAEARRHARELASTRALHAAVAGVGAGRPDELERLERAERTLLEDRRRQTLRICVEPANSLGVAADVSRRFAGILAGAGVRALPCDASGAERILRGRLVATPSSARAQAGSYQRFCSVRLDYQVGGEEGIAGGGSLGGPRDRAGGEDFHQACQASAAAVARALAAALGFVDPPGPRPPAP